MKRPVVLLLLLSLPGAVAAAAFAAEGERVLTGTYTSGYQDGPAGVRAVFTPTGEDEWDVVFYFSHAGRRHAWRGMALGDLVSGTIEGRAENESGGRRFTFRCRFDDGKWRGEHFEIGRRGRESKTGSIVLKARRGSAPSRAGSSGGG